MDSVGLHYRGQSTILDVDKHFIMRRVRIHARHLRILGSMLLHPSTILGGEKVIDSSGMTSHSYFGGFIPFATEDELQQLLNDEGGMADLNLTRKLAVSSPPVTDSSVPAWFLHYRAISLGTYRIRRSNNSRGE
ncbi:hypothetical protein WN944_016774 [Citrus x changshan-huyou]|uniref:Uncharacterized protein n=1 Tax=Citrus x changshan-huyou TaxID=2935761 RepID=A0AAP0MBL2_9ROSI